MHLDIVHWFSELLVKFRENFESRKNEKNLTFGLLINLHDPERILTVSSDNLNVVIDERVHLPINQIHWILFHYFRINFSLLQILWTLDLDQTFIFQIFTCSCATSLGTSST